MIGPMDGFTVPPIIQTAITLVLALPTVSILTLWLKHRYDRRGQDRADRAETRADRAEDRADQHGIAELAKLMQEMAQSALKQAQADLEAARQELREARALMESREREHRRVVGRLTRRVQQLVDAIVSAGLDVPAELPDEPE